MWLQHRGIYRSQTDHFFLEALRVEIERERERERERRDRKEGGKRSEGREALRNRQTLALEVRIMELLI